MTMGPAPMIRMLSRSVRRGMSGLCCLTLRLLNLHGTRELLQTLHHEVQELLEQRPQVVRTGTRLRVALEAERRPVGARNTLERAVEQRAEGGPQHRRQARFVDRETVVLAGDEHAAAAQLLHRVVRAVMTELHL